MNAPRPSSAAPGLLARLSRALLRLCGWSFDIRVPPGPKAVIIVYPHTSNWDFLWGMLAKLGSGFPVGFVGKDSIFVWPLGALWRRLGGIPVDRSHSTGFVSQLQAEFARRDQLWLAIAPEGTRKRTDHWKSGFYHLALAAGVPVGLAYIDYRERRVGLTEYVRLSGDVTEDLALLRAFYAGKVARRPEQASEIRFRDSAARAGGDTVAAP